MVIALLLHTNRPHAGLRRQYKGFLRERTTDEGRFTPGPHDNPTPNNLTPNNLSILERGERGVT